MFNRNNAPGPGSRPDPGRGGLPQRPNQQMPPRQSQPQGSPYDTRMGGYDEYGGFGGGGRGGEGPPPRRPVGQGPPSGGPPSGGRQPVSGRTVQLRPEKNPDSSFIWGNLVAVSSRDFPEAREDFYLLINNLYVFSARAVDNFPQGCIGVSDHQRTCASISLGPRAMVEAQIYDPFSRGGNVYLGSMDMEVGFAGRRTTETPYDQDQLAQAVIQNYENQVFAPGQQLLMDVQSIALRLTVRTVQLVDLTMEKPSSSDAPTLSDANNRGILTRHATVNFYKDPKTGINLKASSRRPAANAVVMPDFKFEDLGIGGLDTEFTAIFRRAFASRIFPPGLVEKIGIQHVRGMLLYGPPGTGKTLIARQIGKMLNAREPKVINGPEVLNKFVGQSEENIRKLFADAEKEFKEKGDESGLHIIIFDELDAVCKQRGSGAGGGTGVGDSVVNQLLSKLDGVDQLNNILLIGMTNRMDMIDEALLRPGRLEVHMEISLPDEFGRSQILKIHTAKMRDNNIMAADVNLPELAKLTKNYSGAEINGLVKAASSFAFSRHIKGGTMAALSEDVAEMQVNRDDFMHALEDVKPLFGASEEELQVRVAGGILHFSPVIRSILDQGQLCIERVRTPESEMSNLFSALMFGPPGSGKTALAAHLGIQSEFPFCKLISPEDMVGFGDMAKIQHIDKTFRDAYKSPLSMIILDEVELMFGYSPVGPRFSSTVLEAITVLLRKRPPKGRRLLVLGTTTRRSVLEELDLLRKFNTQIAVPAVNSFDELANALREMNAFSDSEIRHVMSDLEIHTGSSGVGVGVRDVLECYYLAKKAPDDVGGRFASEMSNFISAARGEVMMAT